MDGPVKRLIEQRFGVSVRSDETLLNNSIGTSTVPILKEDPNRLAMTFVNLSGSTIYLGWFGDVASNKGIRLGPNGGGVSLLFEEDFDWVGREWFAIANASSSALFGSSLVVDS